MTGKSKPRRDGRVDNPMTRRGIEENPEFLSMETLIQRYTPLMRSIYRRFETYYNAFQSEWELQDLWGQIQLDFIALRNEYEPERGVDFTGYIFFHLQNRVYRYVLKNREIHENEFQIGFYGGYAEGDGEDDDISGMTGEREDEKAQYELMKVDAKLSIPWANLSEEESKIAWCISNGYSIEETAKMLKIQEKTVKKQFNTLCESLIGQWENKWGDIFGDESV